MDAFVVQVTAAATPVGSTHTQAPTATKAPVNTPSPFVWSPDAPTLPPLHIQDGFGLERQWKAE